MVGFRVGVIRFDFGVVFGLGSGLGLGLQWVGWWVGCWVSGACQVFFFGKTINEVKIVVPAAEFFDILGFFVATRTRGVVQRRKGSLFRKQTVAGYFSENQKIEVSCNKVLTGLETAPAKPHISYAPLRSLALSLHQSPRVVPRWWWKGSIHRPTFCVRRPRLSIHPVL